MDRRSFIYILGGLASLSEYEDLAAGVFPVAAQPADKKVVGMYVHQHWPYNHPYAARTWTVEDYRGYADGMKKLGYNMLVIWPMLETMPHPLTPSDQQNLAKMSQVISMLHREFGMRVMLALCPNIIANNQEAAKATFQNRHFFYSDQFVDPGNAESMTAMVQWREQLLRPLAEADAITIIDSDPGGYPGSTNTQFVDLFVEHRKMLDRLRPGIELYYWMHVGWQAYCDYYRTGNFRWGTPAESVDIMEKLKKANPTPWGITVHTLKPPPNGTDLQLAQRFGVASTALTFNYGAIEAEPSLPFTNFGGSAAFTAGARGAPGGVVGNAQTHCIQLPNTYAFARGATGKGQPSEQDYVDFANQLIQGQGEAIVQGWKALAGDDTRKMRKAANEIETLAKQPLVPGPLRGLLFGDPERFLIDLVMELRMRAAYDDFVAASEAGQGVQDTLKDFVNAADAWQKRTGYQCAWGWTKMTETLKKLHSPAVDAVLDEKGTGKTPDDRIADHFRITETYTPRLIAAMRQAAEHATG
jgi:hypothetical protein